MYLIKQDQKEKENGQKLEKQKQENLQLAERLKRVELALKKIGSGK